MITLRALAMEHQDFTDPERACVHMARLLRAESAYLQEHAAALQAEVWYLTTQASSRVREAEEQARPSMSRLPEWPAEPPGPLPRLSELPALLRQVDLFHDLSPEELLRLALEVEIREYAEGTLPLRRGEAAEAACLVWEGEVEVSDGERRLLLRTGEWMNEAAVVTGRPHCVWAVAMKPTRVLRIPLDRLIEIGRRHAAVAAYFYCLFIERHPASSRAWGQFAAELSA